MTKKKVPVKKRVIPEGSKQVNFNIPETQLEKVRAIAKKEEKSNSDILNEAVNGHIEKWERDNGKIKLKK